MIATANRIDTVSEYYFSRKLREIGRLNQSGSQVINLGIGSPDFPPPKQVIDRLSTVACQDNTHGYQSYRGTLQLRQAFQQFYQQYYSVTLDPEEEILPLLGSKEGITYISQAYLNPEDTVLVPNPGYPAYAAAARLAGTKVAYYTLREENGWLPLFEELEKTALSTVKLMWVNYPHMPTGATASAGLFQQLTTFAENHNILLCHDNPYSFILNQKPLSVFSGSETLSKHVLELNSLSKSHNMAGWRVGVVVGAAAHINNILKVKSNVDSGMFLGIQEAASQALAEDESWFRSLNATYQKRKALVLTMVNELGAEANGEQAGMFVWAKVPEEIEDVESYLDEILNGARVFITPGFIFGEAGRRYLRISLCNKEEVLAEALDRIKQFKRNKS